MRLKNYLLRSCSYSQGLLACSLSVPLQTDLSQPAAGHHVDTSVNGSAQGGPVGQMGSTSHHSWNRKRAHS